MIDRRHAIRLALVALPAAWLPPSAARAQQGFQQFIPLLVDLPGWQGNKPDGVAMDISGSRMITATREYRRGPARLDVQVIVGQAAQGPLAMTQTDMKMETGDARMSTSTVDGLRVAKAYTVGDKSGTIIVALGTSALLSVSFKGLTEDEALTLARQFNWKAVQAAIPK